MQATKRQLVAMLALNGFTYWGDFLDLQVLPSNIDLSVCFFWTAFQGGVHPADMDSC